MYAYLLFLCLVSAPVIVYSTIHRKMLKKRFGYRLFPAYLLLLAFGFFLLEAVAIQVGWWQLSSDKTLGVTVFGVPIEELIFYILIPQLCIFVWSLLRVDKPLSNLKNMAKHHIGRDNE